MTINAMKSAFIPFDERLAIIDDVVKPRYADLLGRLTGGRGQRVGGHHALSRCCSRARRRRRAALRRAGP